MSNTQSTQETAVETVNDSDTSTTTTAGIALQVADRCDACGAQARSVVTLASGSTLLLCRHHTETNAPKLEEQGATIDRQYAGL